jgi:hypothetical protein
MSLTDARRFLAKNTGLVRAGVRQPNLCTFNQVETTEAWRHRYLAALRG